MAPIMWQHPSGYQLFCINKDFWHEAMEIHIVRAFVEERLRFEEEICALSRPNRGYAALYSIYQWGCVSRCFRNKSLQCHCHSRANNVWV